jgi:hypothetical protein
LAVSLLLAQRQIEAVAKTKQNTFHRYFYASAEDMIAAAREALNTAGLALLVSSSTFHSAAPVADPAAPGANVVGRVLQEYTLVGEHGESAVFVSSAPVVIEKARPQDKAEAAAKTFDLAYFLRGLLLIPREDDEPVDARDDRKHGAAKAPVAAQQQASAQLPALVEGHEAEALLTLLDKATTAKGLELPVMLAKANWKKLSETQQAAVTAKVAERKAEIAKGGQ